MLLQLLFFVTASGTPLNLPNTLALQQPTLNLTTLLNLTTRLTMPPDIPIDPRFDLGSLTNTQIQLNQNSYLATIVSEMAKLTAYDFNGQIGSFQSTSIPEYPGVMIRFRVNTPGQQVDTRIAVWALHTLGIYIASLGGYKETKCSVKWDNVRVASLTFQSRTGQAPTLQQRAVPALDDGSDLPYLQSPAILSDPGENESPTKANTSNMLTYGDFATSCDFVPRVPDLSMATVINGLTSGLARLATVSRTDYMDQAFEATGADAKVAFFGPAFAPTRPTYQYQYATAALRNMAFWLLDQGRFAACRCKMFLDSVSIGGAFLATS